MAQKAEEYGSHPTTFEIPANGTIRYIVANGDVLHEQSVERVTFGVHQVCAKHRSRLGASGYLPSGSHWITSDFLVGETRAHDAELIKYVTPILEAEGVADKFQILAPREATRVTLETIRTGADSIAISGNVLRDYLTDLFPILNWAHLRKCYQS